MELFIFDDDYLHRLRQGDPETAAHFHAYFRDLLMIKLRRHLRTLAEIDGVRQEVFTRCIAGLDQLKDARKLGVFVNAICNQVLIEYYRAEARSVAEEELPDVWAHARIGQSLDDEAASSAKRRRLRKILFPTEPSTIDQKKIDVAVERAVERKN